MLNKKYKLFLLHSGMVSDHVPFRRHMRRSFPNNTKPSWQEKVTSSPGRNIIPPLPTVPLRGLPGKPHESVISKAFVLLTSLAEIPVKTKYRI